MIENMKTTKIFPFLVSLGLFLYFKLKNYFNRDLKKEYERQFLT